MSFTCQVCNTPQPARTKPHKVVTEIRNVQYPPVRDNNGNVKKIPIGYETVKELNVCPECFAMNSFRSSVVDSKVLG